MKRILGSANTQQQTAANQPKADVPVNLSEIGQMALHDFQCDLTLPCFGVGAQTYADTHMIYITTRHWSQPRPSVLV